MSLPAITVVLVNWNGEEFLTPCLRSVVAQGYPGLRVTVVDNGSTDGSLALLARDFAEVEVIRNPVNNYAGANNLAVARASTPFVCLLNTDTVLEAGCLTTLSTRLASDDAVAGVAPKIVYLDGGRLYTTGVLQRDDLYWVDRDQGEPDRGQRDRVEDVFGLSGCCALYRRSVWQQVGGLDEDFHMYYEDVDFSLRLRAAGNRLVFEPAARVRHVGGGSIRKTPDGKDPIGERNRLMVLARHYPADAPREAARSRWLQAASRQELAAFLPILARHAAAGETSFLADLLLHWRDEAAYPQLVRERDAWIVKLLREVRRLRVYRWPWKRLKPIEADFLRRHATE
ncbi:MAG: glycosyltransferase family 2 protein [Planctomycetota bacterium]